jgi:magnesium chelatase family protein
VIQAREVQQLRSNKPNAALVGKEVEHTCILKAPDQHLLEKAMERFWLSARAYHRILKVARTIADLADSPFIQTEHLAESLSYRCLDKKDISTGYTL